MNVLSPLRDEKLGLAGDLQHLAGAAVDLPGHEKGNELFGDFPEIDVPAHEKILVTAVGIAERIGVVLENVDLSGQPLFAQPFFSGR